jgi:osmoprotectant transport system substrate-binding protein
VAMRITRAAGAAAALAVAAAGCVGGANTPNGGGERGVVVVGSANFPESQIVAGIYAEVLRKGGYRVRELPNIGSREVYLRALRKGEISVVPDYVGTLTEYLNTRVNGPDASDTHPLATGDARRTVANLRRLLDRAGGLEVPSYAPHAADQNSFAVTRRTAQKYGLSRLSDLARPEVRGKLVLGAGPDCARRPFCLKGLRTVYGARFREDGGAYRKLDSPGGVQTLAALRDGTIDIGLVFTSDASVEDAGLVRLADDRRLQPSDNVCALVRRGALDARARGLLDRVNRTLRTEDLRALNWRFEVDKQDADDLAAGYVRARGLP